MEGGKDGLPHEDLQQIRTDCKLSFITVGGLIFVTAGECEEV